MGSGLDVKSQQALRTKICSSLLRTPPPPPPPKSLQVLSLDPRFLEQSCYLYYYYHYSISSIRSITIPVITSITIMIFTVLTVTTNISMGHPHNENLDGVFQSGAMGVFGRKVLNTGLLLSSSGLNPKC